MVRFWRPFIVIETSRPLVIGYGNPLREDDGMGLRAAGLLEQQLSPGAAEIIRCRQLTPELAAKFEEASLIVFLDAACDQCPGTVTCEPVTAEGNPAWSHHSSPAELLRLSVQLGSDPKPAFLIRGGIRSMDLGDGLTTLGEKTAKEMADVAHALVRAALTVV